MKHPILGVNGLKELGPALRDLRTSLGKKLVWVCQTLGTTPTHLAQWEKGNYAPNAKSLTDLLGRYGYMMVFMHRDDYATLLASVTRPKEDDLA